MMKSEVALLQFLQKRAEIPVPRPMAWWASANRKLSHEWDLFEKFPGVELRDVRPNATGQEPAGRR
jgi:hypothetical protein